MCAPPLFYLYRSTNNPMLGAEGPLFSRGKRFKQRCRSHVCTHWQERIHQEDAPGLCLASPVFFGAPLQFAWAPTSCIRRICRTEAVAAAAVGWRAGVCAGARVQMF